MITIAPLPPVAIADQAKELWFKRSTQLTTHAISQPLIRLLAEGSSRSSGCSKNNVDWNSDNDKRQRQGGLREKNSTREALEGHKETASFWGSLFCDCTCCSLVHSPHCQHTGEMTACDLQSTDEPRYVFPCRCLLQLLLFLCSLACSSPFVYSLEWLFLVFYQTDIELLNLVFSPH